MIAGLYRPGDSPLHRAPVGAKLLALALGGTLLVLVHDPVAMASLFALALAAFRLGGLSIATGLRQLRPLLVIIAFLFVAQVWISGWGAAFTVSLRLSCLFLLASLVTLTTRVSDMVDTLERLLRPLQPLGLNPERVSLAISLAIRFVPALQSVLAEVREAQRARGLDRNMLALVVPLLVRTLKMADEVAEAIDARS